MRWKSVGLFYRYNVSDKSIFNLKQFNFRSIKRDTFSVQAELEFLDLSYNNISQLDPHYFQVNVGKNY